MDLYNDMDMLTSKYAEKMAFVVKVGITEADSEKEVREIVRKYAPRGKIIAGFDYFPTMDAEL